MVGLHVLPPAVLAVLAIGNQAGHSKRGFAALKGVEQVRIPQLGSALLVQNITFRRLMKDSRFDMKKAGHSADTTTCFFQAQE